MAGIFDFIGKSVGGTAKVAGDILGSAAKVAGGAAAAPFQLYGSARDALNPSATALEKEKTKSYSIMNRKREQDMFMERFQEVSLYDAEAATDMLLDQFKTWNPEMEKGLRQHRSAIKMQIEQMAKARRLKAQGGAFDPGKIYRDFNTAKTSLEKAQEGAKGGDPLSQAIAGQAQQDYDPVYGAALDQAGLEEVQVPGKKRKWWFDTPPTTQQQPKQPSEFEQKGMDWLTEEPPTPQAPEAPAETSEFQAQIKLSPIMRELITSNPDLWRRLNALRVKGIPWSVLIESDELQPYLEGK